MCTSIVIKAQDGNPLYGRTMEWGGFDLESQLVLAPRGTSFTSALSTSKQGMMWKNQFGFIAINAANLPYAMDGMNETGLTIGVLYLPGFAQYQEVVEGEEASTLNQADLAAYILGTFSRVAPIKQALPKLTVVDNKDVEKEFGAPVPIHWVVTDETGESVVVEYIEGRLHLYDNKIGVMTNSPGYDWHLLNLRNYSESTAAGTVSPSRDQRGQPGALWRWQRHAWSAGRFHAPFPLCPGRGLFPDLIALCRCGQRHSSDRSRPAQFRYTHRSCTRR